MDSWRWGITSLIGYDWVQWYLTLACWILSSPIWPSLLYGKQDQCCNVPSYPQTHRNEAKRDPTLVLNLFPSPTPVSFQTPHCGRSADTFGGRGLEAVGRDVEVAIQSLCSLFIQLNLVKVKQCEASSV
ncbi:hypothetical protein V8F20_007040 [Naviculisporaceae sp. PSN 640]